MSSRRFNLIVLASMIYWVCPSITSAQEKSPVSQSSNAKANNEKRKENTAKTASKTDAKKKPDPSQNETKKRSGAADKPEKKERSAEQKRSRTQKQKNQRFVDRNGDGIHDGMEHRFRRRHQKARSSKHTDSHGRHLRQQHRRGAKGPPPGKGMHGVE